MKKYDRARWFAKKFISLRPTLFLVMFFDRNFVTVGHGSYTSWIYVKSVRTLAGRTSALAFCCLNSKSSVFLEFLSKVSE